MTPKHIATTMAALARAALPPGAALPATASVRSVGQPAGIAPRGAMPSQAGAGNKVAIVDALNAAHGLQPGTNPRGPFAAAIRPAARAGCTATPQELANRVNAEAGLRPGANVPPEFAARFAHLAQEAL